MSIKYQNLHSFEEGLIVLCQRILETRRIPHLHGSTHFTIPLKTLLDDATVIKVCFMFCSEDCLILFFCCCFFVFSQNFVSRALVETMCRSSH